jgi:WD40 repeat protein
VSVSPDGMSVVLAVGESISIWQMHGRIRSSKSPIRHSSMINCVTISPDSSVLASGSSDGTVKLWNFRTGACLHTFGDHSETIAKIAISPDSSLVSSHDGVMRVWRVADGAPVFSLRPDYFYRVDIFHGARHPEWGRTAFSHDCRQFASISTSGKIDLWEIEGRRIIGTFFHPQMEQLEDTRNLRIRFTHDGTGIIVSDGRQSRSWKVMSRSALPSGDVDTYQQVEFVPKSYASEDEWIAFYKYAGNSDWITDQHGRKICWVPADLRGRNSYCQGSKVAIGANSGRLSWFDFGRQCHY